MLGKELTKQVDFWKMPFGKYKGKKFADIDDKYILWLVSETNFFQDDKYPRNKIIRTYFADRLNKSVKDIPPIVQHVEEHNMTTIEWINANIMKLEELITNYEVMKDEDVTSKNVIDELQRCQRYMGEIIDIINFRS